MKIDMKKYIVLILSGLLMAFMLTARADNSDPVSMLNSIADQLIANLKDNRASLKTNPQLVYSLANKIVVPHADLAAMSKRVLPPRIWDSATPSQKNEFQQEFTQLLVRTYASALADYKDQTIRFYPVRGGYQGKATIRVDSQVMRTDGPSISMNYRLLWNGSEWKVYDMTVEGISLLESFRSQFADKLSHGGSMADLIQEMNRHNNRSRNG